jgi:hypothetical protein
MGTACKLGDIGAADNGYRSKAAAYVVCKENLASI